MGKLIIFFSIVLLPSFAFGTEKPEYKSTIDYIQKTGRLWGISEIRINEDNSVTLLDSESGYGSELMMSLTKVVKSKTINVGETSTLSDGHHVFITYEFKKLNKKKITFLVIDKFDARSFGDGIKKESITITILPYKEEKKPQQ